MNFFDKFGFRNQKKTTRLSEFFINLKSKIASFFKKQAQIFKDFIHNLKDSSLFLIKIYKLNKNKDSKCLKLLKSVQYAPLALKFSILLMKYRRSVLVKHFTNKLLQFDLF